MQDFVAETFRQLGLDWQEHVETDPALFRPSDIERSCGNAAKAHEKLGWKPKHKFADIIRFLVEAGR